MNKNNNNNILSTLIDFKDILNNKSKDDKITNRDIINFIINKFNSTQVNVPSSNPTQVNVPSSNPMSNNNPSPVNVPSNNLMSNNVPSNNLMSNNVPSNNPMSNNPTPVNIPSNNSMPDNAPSSNPTLDTIEKFDLGTYDKDNAEYIDGMLKMYNSTVNLSNEKIFNVI
jgi:hypothetical protein